MSQTIQTLDKSDLVTVIKDLEIPAHLYNQRGHTALATSICLEGSTGCYQAVVTPLTDMVLGLASRELSQPLGIIQVWVDGPEAAVPLVEDWVQSHVRIVGATPGFDPGDVLYNVAAG